MGAKDISSMAENLGTLLRITLDQNSKEVPFKEGTGAGAVLYDHSEIPL